MCRSFFEVNQPFLSKIPIQWLRFEERYKKRAVSVKQVIDRCQLQRVSLLALASSNSSSLCKFTAGFSRGSSGSSLPLWKLNAIFGRFSSGRLNAEADVNFLGFRIPNFNSFGNISSLIIGRGDKWLNLCDFISVCRFNRPGIISIYSGFSFWFSDDSRRPNSIFPSLPSSRPSLSCGQMSCSLHFSVFLEPFLFSSWTFNSDSKLEPSISAPGSFSSSKHVPLTSKSGGLTTTLFVGVHIVEETVLRPFLFSVGISLVCTPLTNRQVETHDCVSFIVWFSHFRDICLLLKNTPTSLVKQNPWKPLTMLLATNLPDILQWIVPSVSSAVLVFCFVLQNNFFEPPSPENLNKKLR